MTSQFISSMPEEAEATLEKMARSCPMTASLTLPASISPVAMPMPRAATLRA